MLQRRRRRDAAAPSLRCKSTSRLSQPPAA